jgi:hypothetical protein
VVSNLVSNALEGHAQVFPVLTEAQLNRIRPFASLRHVNDGDFRAGSGIVSCLWKSALRSQKPMILKIAQIRDLHKVRLRLSGEFRSHHLDQVKATISRGEPTVLDLEEVDLVDIEAIRFLNAREDEGISVLHCSPYIQEWMSRERQEEKARTDWR